MEICLYTPRNRHCWYFIYVQCFLSTICMHFLLFQLSGQQTADDHPQVQSLIGFMEAGNELGTVKNQTILTAIPGMRKFPGNLKDLYDNIVEEREKLKQHFITDGAVSYFVPVNQVHFALFSAKLRFLNTL